MRKNTLRCKKLLALCVMATTYSSQSQAVDQIRTELPVVAGTELQLADDQSCTAGVVLKSTKFWDNITAYRRAVRYVVTAKHCVVLNEVIKVGGHVIGKVIWVSPSTDIALIRVPPSTNNHQACGITHSGVQRCWLDVDYWPRASGKVILGAWAARETRPEPVPGAGTPAPHAHYCTSGFVTDVNCMWFSSPFPPQFEPYPASVVGASNNVRGLQPGDSGGPVMGYDGTIYGIISFRQQPMDPNLPYFMGYTSIARVSVELPDYVLAPP